MFDFLFNKKLKCPYCGIIIESEPQRKFKCLACNKQVFVKKTDNKIKLLTISDYEALQKKKKEEAQRKKYYRFFSMVDASQGFLDQKLWEWVSKNNSREINYNDLTWWLANWFLDEHMKTKDYNVMSELYYSMAHLQKERGMDFYHLLQEHQRMKLYQYRKDLRGYKVELSVISGCKDPCIPCLQVSRKKISIKEALDSMPIPIRDCTNKNGLCTCFFSTDIINDDNRLRDRTIKTIPDY